MTDMDTTVPEGVEPEQGEPEAPVETLAQRIKRETTERLAAVDARLAEIETAHADLRAEKTGLLAEKIELVRLVGATEKRAPRGPGKPKVDEQGNPVAPKPKGRPKGSGKGKEGTSAA